MRVNLTVALVMPLAAIANEGRILLRRANGAPSPHRCAVDAPAGYPRRYAVYRGRLHDPQLRA